MKPGYVLDVRIELVRVEWDETRDPDGQYPTYTNERLSVDQRKTLGPMRFSQLAMVLERFATTADEVGAMLKPAEEATRP